MILSLSPALTETDFIGGDSKEDPPVPFPNTEVKLFCADGTAWATMWESRSPPIFFYKKVPNQIHSGWGLFFCSLFLAFPLPIPFLICFLYLDFFYNQ